MIPSCRIDHLVVTAVTLEAGADYVEGKLGIRPQSGGRHPRMGTHNLLLRFGHATYLEVIAPDPAAAPPPRPRWFGLDALRPDSRPRLSAWVARTSNIAAAANAATEPLGSIEPMSRGSLAWHITIPEDGIPVLGGVAPALIEWSVAEHPAAGLPDHGLSLGRLELRHPEAERIRRLLQSLGFEGPAAVVDADGRDTPCLSVEIQTPQGCRVLSGDGGNSDSEF